MWSCNHLLFRMWRLWLLSGQQQEEGCLSQISAAPPTVAQLWHHWCGAESEPAETPLTAEAPLPPEHALHSTEAGPGSVALASAAGWRRWKWSRRWCTRWHSTGLSCLTTCLTLLHCSAAPPSPWSRSGSGRTSARRNVVCSKVTAGRMVRCYAGFVVNWPWTDPDSLASFATTLCSIIVRDCLECEWCKCGPMSYSCMIYSI